MVRTSVFSMAGIGIAAAIGFVIVLGSIGSTITKGSNLTALVGENDTARSTTTSTASAPGIPSLLAASTQDIAKFSSIDELRTFLANVESNRSTFVTAQTGLPESFSGSGPSAADANIHPGASSALERTMRENSPTLGEQTGESIQVDSNPLFSHTNNQLTGVDEPDFVKNDGKFAYVLWGGKLTISRVYPPENATVAARMALEIKNGQSLQNMFLNNNTLVVFYVENTLDQVIPQYEFAPQQVYIPKTHVILLDIADRTNPKTVRDYVVSGSYRDARMIGERVYLITTSDLYSYRQPLVPRITESSSRTVLTPDIYYFKNPESTYDFDTVTSIGLSGSGSGSTSDAAALAGRNISSKTFMMSPASILYVSQDNIYIAYQKYLPYNYYEQSSRDRFFTAVLPLLPDDVQVRIKEVDSDKSTPALDKWDKIATILQDTYNRLSEVEKNRLFENIQKSLAEHDSQTQNDAEKTVIHKIAIDPSGEIEYKAKGEVNGRLLNQFSMDESNDRLRVATIVEKSSLYRPGLYSNVYVLDDQSLQVAGKLENIQPGEMMHSSRFIGDKLYMVTFQKIDPFFVIDLSRDNPRVLGALKLPGYSTYLQPYDESHIVGIGKDTKGNGSGGAVPVGVKLALFDVSDVANPKLEGDYLIPGSGTDSEALMEHKALLFSKDDPNILSIPITKYDAGSKDPSEGPYLTPDVWRGFYVFEVSHDKGGIKLKGTVEHSNHYNIPDNNYYSSSNSYGLQGSRSFYIGPVLYTVSAGNLIKMNDLNTLTDLGQLQIGNTSDVAKDATSSLNTS
jgi:inhibitor of cysteine peptidase